MKTLNSFSLQTGAFLLAAIGVLAQSGVPQRRAAPQADTSYQQGMKDVQRGDLSEARTAFEQAVKLAPNSAEAHNSLGWVLLSQGHIEDAVTQLKTAVQLGPKLLQARINLANALVRQRDLSGAETEARWRAYPSTLAPKPWTTSTSWRLTRSSATLPARSPNSGYAVLRSMTVVPRRPASGKVR